MTRRATSSSTSSTLLGFGLGICLALGSGCGEELLTPDEPAPADESYTYTWHGEVAPLVAQKCGSCHVDGDIAPFALTTYEEVSTLAALLGPAIETGAMPPWPPSPGCNEYNHDRSLSDEDKELLLTWIDEGTPLGDPETAAPLPEPPAPWVADALIEMPEAYTPTQEPDDYRCFLVDGPALDSTSYVTGLEVYPGERSIVHHVIAFLVDPANIPTFEAYDEADPGPGYGCFGGPTGESEEGTPAAIGARWLGSWVPGAEPMSVPEGTGMRIEPGSKVVVQMHYNTSSTTPLADRSTVGLTLVDAVEQPGMMMPFTNFAWVLGTTAMTIPAGEASVTHSFAGERSNPLMAMLLGEIGAEPEDTLQISHGGLHMHLLGRSGRLAVEHEDGEESCLVQIDDWDFGWQGGYDLSEPVAFGPQDKLSISCEWDNSAENQPIVDGQILEPQDVEWGDGSFDEMCLSVVYVSK